MCVCVRVCVCVCVCVSVCLSVGEETAKIAKMIGPSTTNEGRFLKQTIKKISATLFLVLQLQIKNDPTKNYKLELM